MLNDLDDEVAGDFDSSINDINSSQHIREGELARSQDRNVDFFYFM